MNTVEKIEKLRQLMKRESIDFYVVPTDDFHGSEYVGEYFKTREFLSGFDGSAGTLVIAENFAGLWTDGRYFIQAERQLDGSGITLMRSGQPSVPTVAGFLEKRMEDGQSLGFDGRCISIRFMEELENKLKKKKIRIAYEQDLAEELWENRPALSCRPIWLLEDTYTGEARAEKLERVREQMREKQCKALLLTSLDDIAWLFNFRGDDIAYNPVALSYALVKEETAELFIQPGAVNQEVCAVLAAEGIRLKEYKAVYEEIGKLGDTRLWIDDEKTNYALLKSIRGTVKVIRAMSPVSAMKAIKNETEIENIRKAHRKDGVAVTKFMYWLKTHVGNDPITELTAADYLEELRSDMEHYLGQSFEPIMAAGAHAAICHYSATRESSADLETDKVLLFDTGGHYLEGTTDITRTCVFGQASPEFKRHYTAVLRGNLNLGAAKFQHGCTGINLDILARTPLWEQGLDYNHGTGHGVGYLLNVHEKPNSIRWRHRGGYGETAVFEEGMVTSNEPGFYLEDRYGIRLENMILCREAEKNEYGQFMKFETLTLVPFDLDAVDVALLTKRERALLNDYHRAVFEKISPFLAPEEASWLKLATREI